MAKTNRRRRMKNIIDGGRGVAVVGGESSSSSSSSDHSDDNSNSSGQQGHGHPRRPLHQSTYYHRYRTASIAASCCCLLLSSPAITATNIGGGGGGGGLRKQQQRKLAKSKFCPDTHTGKVPTTRCSGYVSCSEGKQSSSIQSCASGTMFDIKSNTCTWPSNVDCKVGKELAAELNAGTDNGSDDNANDNDRGSEFCPDRYTGRAPTTNCGGYVQCTKGSEGLSVNCPPKTTFNSGTNLCEYNLDTCTMLKGPSRSNNDDAGSSNTNNLDRYCPIDYTGRAPTSKCKGYVDCKNGKARRSKVCPGDTKFDVMILACTYTESGCDAVEFSEDDNNDVSGGGGKPTAAPTTKRQARVESLVDDCPAGHTGYVTLPGCTQYIWCAGGQLVNTIDCPDGTLFNGQICTWPDSVECDSTALPTMVPTEQPTYEPTGEPTFEPTPLNMEYLEEIWYPNFTSGVCVNDGKFPSTVGRQYLFTQSINCCESYFQNNLQACARAVRPTPSPTPSAGAIWYPDYTNSICSSNVNNHGAFETNFFYTYTECCDFEWIRDKIKCLRNEPTIKYYPDYKMNACKNDGGQSVFENNLFETLEDCCAFDWIDYGLCMAGSGVGNGNDVGNGGDGDNGGQGVVEGIEYYPDYKNNVCHCDQQQSVYEVNIFSTYESCCDFDLVDSGICRQYKNYQQEKCTKKQQQLAPIGNPNNPSPSRPNPTPSKPPPPAIWYPDDQNRMCRDDGKEPEGVLMTSSHYICCKRFMPQVGKECVTRSETWSFTLDNGGSGGGGNTVPTVPNYTPPTRPNVNGPTSPVGQPSVPSTPSGSGIGSGNQCQDLNVRKCLKSAQCHWDRDSKQCSMIGAAVGGDTTAPGPTPQPPTSANAIWYADDSLRICRDDGQQYPDAKMSTSIESCCQRYMPQDRSYCILKSEELSLTLKDDGLIVPTNDDGDICSLMSLAQCQKATSLCRIDQGSQECVSIGQHNMVNQGAAPAQTPTSPNLISNGGSGNKYYPDYFHSICRNDGKQIGGEQYDSPKQCCKNPWIDYKNCIKHAEGKRQVENDLNTGKIGGNGVPMNKLAPRDVEPAPPAANPYYPDYFYNVCRNDGLQSYMEDMLFTTMQGCCEGVEYINYDSCMSNAGS